MSTRKPCVNIPTASYTGKEQSPLHFGLSAEGYELNTIMEGYDHLLWQVKIKNNKKVWVRQISTNSKMVHEEPVILQNEIISENTNIKTTPEIIKPNVEEKKITDYNLFLTYRLHELKNNKNNKSNNKEIFNTVIAEWKELKKKPTELANIITLAQEFHNKNKKN